ncbi:MAG: YitT family protein [Clostridiales bacterium]|nr:YitT family protein [Clostridiales bacterium]
MWNFLKKYIIMTFGSALLAFGISEFLVPNRLAVGGVSGLATIVHYVMNVPMGVLVMLFNVPIFIMGALAEGREFLVKSVYATLMLSVFLQIMEKIPVGEYDFLLSALYGGVLSGAGIGIVLVAGGTTGGTDIVAKILQKKIPSVSFGVMVMLADAVVITLATVVFGNLQVGLYSAVALFAATQTIDYITQGVNFAHAVFIISEKHEQICERIHQKLNRGATALYGAGTYEKDPKTILLCTVRPGEIPSLKSMVYSIDSAAFIVTMDAREVTGKGFARLSTSAN